MADAAAARRNLALTTAVAAGLIGLILGWLLSGSAVNGLARGLLLFAPAGIFVGWFWPPPWSRWGAALVATALGFFLLATIGLRPFG